MPPGVLTALQKGPVDIANYYDAQLKFAGSLVRPVCHGAGAAHAGLQPVLPLKPYYAFKAFGELYRLGTEVFSSIEGEGLYALAASDGKTGKVLLVNFWDVYAVDRAFPWRAALERSGQSGFWMRPTTLSRRPCPPAAR